MLPDPFSLRLLMISPPYNITAVAKISPGFPLILDPHHIISLCAKKWPGQPIRLNLARKYYGSHVIIELKLEKVPGTRCKPGERRREIWISFLPFCQNGIWALSPCGLLGYIHTYMRTKCTRESNQSYGKGRSSFSYALYDDEALCLKGVFVGK